jgi:ABC-2 type transport system permease protein
MRAVLEKEFRQYFHFFVGYFFLAVFLFFAGYYFVMGNLFPQNGELGTFSLSMLSVSISLIPLLTMRSFAEEARQKTAVLLITSPMSMTRVVLGKFFALFLFFCTGLCATLVYVVILSYYGSFDPLVTLGNYTAMMLSAAAFIAMGMLVSSLTESQAIAAALSYAVLFGLWMLDFLAPI